MPAILTGSAGSALSWINPIDLGQYRSLDLFPALLIFELGLIDEVLAPASTKASTNKRPVPEWQCQTAKAKSSASTPTDMHVNERAVGRSGGLFVWVAGMGSTQPLRVVLLSYALAESKGTGAMPTGLFKTPDESVQVDYDGLSIPIPRSTYENNGYKPDFDNLPPEAEYRAAKEKLGNVPRP
jgi:hypothetical protein